MQSQAHVVDSPIAWVKSHIQDYIESNGAKGHRWRGLPTLLLTTQGRRSGLLRRTALIYGRHENNYVLVASNGGAPKHPLWYFNLVANPNVELQVGADLFSALARVATSEEKRYVWPLMTAIFPRYNTYQAQAQRDIPVIIVEPGEHARL